MLRVYGLVKKSLPRTVLIDQNCTMTWSGIAEVPDAVVVWSVNVGGGDTSNFATRFGGQALPFRPGAIPSSSCTCWVRDGAGAPPEAVLKNRLATQGIPSLIGIHTAGRVRRAHIVPAGVREPDEFSALAAQVEEIISEAGGIWCPALIVRGLEAESAIAMQYVSEREIERLAEHVDAPTTFELTDYVTSSAGAGSSRSAGIRIKAPETAWALATVFLGRHPLPLWLRRHHSPR